MDKNSVLTTQQAAEQIARAHVTWSGQLGTAASISYGFLDAGDNRFSAAQITATEAAMALWSDVAQITFNPANGGDPNNPYVDAGMSSIELINYNADDGSEAGTNTSFDGGRIESARVGFNLHNTDATFLDYGTKDFQSIVHELGHAIGLSHPGDYNAAKDQVITYDNDRAYIEDTTQYSLMSYFDETNTGAQYAGLRAVPSGQDPSRYPAAPMLHDIAAAQLLYGANTQTRQGNDVYGFHSNVDRAVFHLSNAFDLKAFAIWDGAGNDTLDLSGYSKDQRIDLHAGSFSDAGGLVGNIAIAENCDIENARGGSGDDQIFGNDLANLLDGGAGQDFMLGYAGDDAMSGATGNDRLEGQDGNDLLSGGYGDDNLIGGNGADLLLGGSGKDVLYGGAQDDTLQGESGDDKLSGDQGTDLLEGGDGDDALDGGTGGDTMKGGAGKDTYYVGSSKDVIFETSLGSGLPGLPGPSDTDTVITTLVAYTLGANVENLFRDFVTSLAFTGTGNAVANLIKGGAGNDILSGLGGDDTLDGGSGADTLAGGAGNDTYIVDNASDSLSETGVVGVVLGKKVYGDSGGIDTVKTGLSTYRLSDGVLSVIENLTFTGTTAFRGFGNVWDNKILAGTQGDLVHGGDGQDTIYGYSGNDSLYGDKGNDSLTGGTGADGLDLGQGDDRAYVDNGTAAGGDGVIGGGGDDTVIADATMSRTGLNLRLYDAGTSITTAINAVAFTSFAIDVDHVIGNAGADMIDAGRLTAALTVAGGAGDDTLLVGRGSESFDGGAGSDEAVLQGSLANFSFESQSIPALGGRSILVSGGLVSAALHDVETLVFRSGGHDTVVDLSSFVMVEPAPGDPANAYAGNAVHDGTTVLQTGTLEGSQTLRDIVDFSDTTGALYVDLTTGAGNVLAPWTAGNVALLTDPQAAQPSATAVLASVEGVIGGQGDAFLFGDGHDNVFTAVGTGTSQFVGRGGNDVFHGSIAGTQDTVDYQFAAGSVFVDLGKGEATGADGHDTFDHIENIFSSSFADVLKGDGKANAINADAGNDILIGGGGDDVLVGLDGDDVMAGGSGADTFGFWNGHDGHDTIIDFNHAQGDLIDFSFSPPVATFADLSIVSDADGDAVIGFGHNTITLLGVSATNVDQSCFLFA